MTFPHNRIPTVGVAAFAVVVTWLSLSQLLTEPWHIITELGADGGKNMFTFLYHSLYEKGIWFGGMNYPYGEHLVFTDAQPLLSITAGYLGKGISLETGLTLLWWPICLSHVFATIFTYSSLKKLAVNPWIALVCAGCITMLSPQCIRFSAHFGLSYFCYLPMLFYWTLQYYNSSHWKYIICIFLLGVVGSLIHPYYVAVSLVWAFAYGVGYLFLNQQPFVSRLRHALGLLLAVVLTFVCFGLFMKLTDPITDRPQTPFGTLENCATLRTIITSAYSPFWAWVQHHLVFDRLSAGGEGFCYPSLVALIAMGGLGLQFIRQKVRPKSEHRIVQKKQFPPVFLLIGAFALLLSMGIPFIWRLEWLLNYASVLRQFRTLGRFSWIFYYVITMYAAVAISAVYQQLRDRAQLPVLVPITYLTLVLGVWVVESVGYCQRSRAIVTTGRSNYTAFTAHNWSPYLQEKGYKSSDFQAIIVLPFYMVGSEKLWVCSNENASAYAVAASIKASLQLHLPVVDAMLSRSSWSTTFQQVKIAGGPFTEKPMFNNLIDRRPFLLLHVAHIALNPDQQYLINQSKLIGQYNGCMAYACYPNEIMHYEKALKDSILHNYAPTTQTDTCLQQGDFWMAKHYADSGVAYTPNGNSIIVDTTFEAQSHDTPYEFSCWFKLPNNNYRSPECTLILLDKAGKTLATYLSPTKESTDNRGMWFRNNLHFTLPAYTCRIVVQFTDLRNKHFEWYNHINIRPANATTIWKVGNDRYSINNHWIATKR